MIDGITFRGDDFMPVGRACLLRRDQVITVGPVASVIEHYKPGDVVVVSHEFMHDLAAQLARDVTPKRTLPRH